MEHITEAELKELLEDTLPLESQTVIIGHLDHCEECRQRMSDYTESVASMSAVESHPDYRASLVDQIQAAAVGMRVTNLEQTAQSLSQLSRIRSIDTGGFGEVFEYKDLRFNRSVAVKILQDRWVNNPDAVQRFLREMELTAEIDHPGCPTVYGSGKTEDGRDFYWMQLVTGDSLKDIIQRTHQSATFSLRRRDSQLRQLLTTFIQICDAIEVAHQKGILHRDLKPSNIRQHANQFPVVLDWGLATRQSSAEDGTALSSSHMQSPELTSIGDHLGSPAFISPEAAGGKTSEVGKRSDIYLLGGVLYAILTGEGPHESLIDSAKDMSTILQTIQAGHMPSFKGVPPELASIGRKALAVKIEDRYESALALSKDIGQWLAGEPAAAHRYGVAGLVGLAARRRPGTTAVGLIAVGLLAVLSVLSFVWWRDAAEQRLIAENRFGLGLKAWQTLIARVQSDLSTTGGTAQVRRSLIELSSAGIAELLVDAGKQPGAELIRIQAEMELAHIRAREKGEIAAAREDYRRLRLQLETMAYSHDLPERYQLLGDALKGQLVCTASIEGAVAAESFLLELLRWGEVFENRFPGVPSATMMAAQAEVLAARFRQNEGEAGLADAFAHYERAENKLRQLPNEVLEQPRFAYELLLVKGGQAELYHELGEFQKAVSIQAEIVPQMKRICDLEPVRRNRIGLITDQMNLGIYLKKISLEQGAEKLVEALAGAEQLKLSYIDDVVIAQLVRQVENNLAGTYRALGRPNDAIRLLRRSIESQRIDFVNDDLDQLDDYALSWGALGNAYKSAKQLTSAADAYLECARIRRAIQNRNPQDYPNRNELLSVATSCASVADLGHQVITSFLEELAVELTIEECERLRQAGQSQALAFFYRFLGSHLLEQARATQDLEKATRAKSVLSRSADLFHELGEVKGDPLQQVKQDLDSVEQLLESLGDNR
jgi:tetratricopeptide (TPR) repeat protein